MKNAFLYEYLRYAKDELKFFENPDNIGQANAIKAIICNDTRGDIEGDYLEQVEVINKLETIVGSMKIAKNKKSSPKTEEDKALYELCKEAGYRLNRYGKSIGRIHNT